MMNCEQIELILDGCALIEYCGNLYEYIGDQDGKHVFSDINDGEPIFVSDKALRNSSEFDFTFRY